MATFHSYTFICFVHPTGLPLDYHIEGPLSTADIVFVLGARPTTSGYDFNIIGRLSGVVLIPSLAPPQFSLCVLDCLETLITDTIGTAVTALPFDEANRQLILNGPAQPSEFTQVLRALVYLNRAPDINLNNVTLQVGMVMMIHVCT